MSEMSCEEPITVTGPLTRDSLVNFPFPSKLWIVATADFIQCLGWNDDGTALVVDILNLSDYLKSSKSIFKVKTFNSFIELLLECQFEYYGDMGNNTVSFYRNSNFQRDRRDLLCYVTPKNPITMSKFKAKANDDSDIECEDDSDVEGDKNFPKGFGPLGNLRGSQHEFKNVAKRMAGDLCFSNAGQISAMQRNQVHVQTSLNYLGEKKKLDFLMHTANKRCNGKRINRTMGPKAPPTFFSPEQVVSMLPDTYEDPRESRLDETLTCDEFAGFYGQNFTMEQLKNFFGELLPVYGTEETDEMIPTGQPVAVRIEVPGAKNINLTSTVVEVDGDSDADDPTIISFLESILENEDEQVNREEIPEGMDYADNEDEPNYATPMQTESGKYETFDDEQPTCSKYVVQNETDWNAYQQSYEMDTVEWDEEE